MASGTSSSARGGRGRRARAPRKRSRRSRDLGEGHLGDAGRGVLKFLDPGLESLDLSLFLPGIEGAGGRDLGQPFRVLRPDRLVGEMSDMDVGVEEGPEA